MEKLGKTTVADFISGLGLLDPHMYKRLIGKVPYDLCNWVTETTYTEVGDRVNVIPRAYYLQILLSTTAYSHRKLCYTSMYFWSYLYDYGYGFVALEWNLIQPWKYVWQGGPSTPWLYYSSHFITSD